MAVSHVIGGLTAADGRVFRSHLLECRSCRDKVGELRAIAHELEDVERDERRNTVTKRTETKQRKESEADVDVGDEPRILSRRTVGVLAAFVVALAVLAGWNFMLRAQLGDFQRLFDERLEASAALQLGTAWTVTDSGPVTGQVKTHDGDIVVFADGLSNRLYGLYLLDTEGRARYRQALQPQDGMVLALVPAERAPEDAVRLEIIRTDTLSADPVGTPVFEAHQQPQAPEQPQAR